MSFPRQANIWPISLTFMRDQQFCKATHHHMKNSHHFACCGGDTLHALSRNYADMGKKYW